MDWNGDMADKIGTNEYGEILIYQTDDGQTNIEVKIEDDTVWLTQQQMSELFQTSRTNVVEHIKHIYEEGELEEVSTCRNFRQVRKEGNREVTNSIFRRARRKMYPSSFTRIQKQKSVHLKTENGCVFPEKW